MQTGTVVEYHREFCIVRLDSSSERVMAKPRGRLQLDERQFARQIAIGDRVEVEAESGDSHSISAVQPRETYLLRRNMGSFKRKPQCIVANADQLAVITATVPDLRVNVIDRFFIAAIEGGLQPLLVVNKVDLQPDIANERLLNVYREQGYSVVLTSATSGLGIAELQALLAGKLTAFCGHSGVGKSTLLTLLTGHEIKVGDVNERTGKGRQTTVTSHLYELPGGGDAVDTPGIREFGLHNTGWLEINEYFAEIAALAQGCGFRDCTHTHEPDCKVRTAVAGGRLDQRRLDSYARLREESDVRHWEQ